nr:UDP-glucosyltransferase 2-like [Procambarus clarkii]
MELAVMSLLMMALTGGIAGELAPPERPYKILMLFPVSTKSYSNTFLTLAEALADRGHKVVMLTNHPKSSNHPNISEITHGLTYFREENINVFQSLKNPSKLFELVPTVARDLYHVPAVKDLYNSRKQFDLMIVSIFVNELSYPFLLGMPFVSVLTQTLNPRQSAAQGNVLHPAYVPSWGALRAPASAWERGLNALSHIYKALDYRFRYLPLVQKEISAHFPDLPPLQELERNSSLTFINTHFTLGAPLPLLPSQVEVAAMHCRPGKLLPQELESWITGAGSAGVIYFALGSFIRGKNMPSQYRDLFLQAFRRLPQRVIWKYEEELENVPDNVMISNWLPQQDILAHHRVKVFITHGGMFSMLEAIYHATPLLVLPISNDQPRNAMFVTDAGVGLTLAWDALTVDILLHTLARLINHSKYKDNVLKMSAGLRDQPTSPRDLAVFWTEYVIRHRGAPHLRSPAAQLSWVEFLMLDVILLLLLALFIFYFILRRFLSLLSRDISGSAGSAKKD